MWGLDKGLLISFKLFLVHKSVFYVVYIDYIDLKKSGYVIWKHKFEYQKSKLSKTC